MHQDPITRISKPDRDKTGSDEPGQKLGSSAALSARITAGNDRSTLQPVLAS
jgi:hypothetical protein